ncbi:nucleotidyltransferase family protein [Bdellovibrio sp. HCB337]|uniref:nucleotidyltransferase family protein n=1 Tax=Bdellovibrio sp. HCB337 TaxID=3394358 RepID=UPI0039A707C0
MSPDFFTKPSHTLRSAMEAIDRNSMQICFVLDDDGKLIGALTDGDIRRALLKGATLEQEVGTFMSRAPRFVPNGMSRADIVEKLKSWNVRQLPVVDEKGRVIGIETSDDLRGLLKRNNQVILMAGGFGKRLSPLTDTLPKPLLRIGGQPILETIIKRFRDVGFYRFVLIVNYRGEMIRDHFKDGKELGVEIEYLCEETPLGTCGGLSLLKEKPTEPVFVMNGDILTRADFGAILDQHCSTNATATMVVREYYTEVPYGVVKVQGDRILSIEEKPKEMSYVNAGVYVLSPEAVAMIPQKSFFDMPSLFNMLKDSGREICCYKLKDYWVDIGRMEDFHRAQADFEGHFGS